jgi:hypothetical protein
MTYQPTKLSKPTATISVFSKEGFLNSPLTAKKNFSALHNEYLLDSLDDSYESFKNFSTSFYNTASKVPNINNPYNVYPHSYTRVIDPFRADYEEVLWGVDKNSLEDSLLSVADSPNYRLSNQMKLRSTTRNSIVSYNAMQKVFKSRLDEGRSHSRLSDFANSSTPHNFVTAPKVNYESLLSKNKNSFFYLNHYYQSFNKDFSLMSSVHNSLNSILLDIPFLISEKSDPSRYL